MTDHKSVTEVLANQELGQLLRSSLRRQGYLSHIGYSYPDPLHPRDTIDLVAWQPEHEDAHIVITVCAGQADERTIAKALTHLGWYREHRKPHASAWVVAKDFTDGARYAAQGCQDLALYPYHVKLSLGEPLPPKQNL